jgi:DUF1707 SHOCT-like domain
VTNVPEPVDPRTLRASDADRDRVASVLRDAVGQGRISFEELDERLGVVYSARTYADLEAVTRDLPAPGAVLPVPGAVLPVPAAPGGLGAGRIGGTPGATSSVAIMSNAKRAGAWVVPDRYVAVSLMGGVQLDLRQARFAEPRSTIWAYALMGSIEIIAPEDIEVEVAGIPIMANFEHKASGPGLPGAPTLKVAGFALMGDVHVKRASDADQGDGKQLGGGSGGGGGRAELPGRPVPGSQP